MNKVLKIVLGVLLGAAVVLQFFGPEAPEVIETPAGDLIQSEALSGEVATLLKTACYDCHSSETVYPWYSHIMPVSSFIYPHIEEGREELNFSNWSSYSKRDKLRKLKDIQEEVEERKMPLESYTYLHGDAKLSTAQRELIVSWAKDHARELLVH